MTNKRPPREQQYKLHHKQETFMLDWSNLMFSYKKKPTNPGRTVKEMTF